MTPEDKLRLKALRLKAEFKRDVCDRSKEVDPEEQYLWWEISYGYFLAKGCTPDEAHELAREVRYQDEYFTEPAPVKECTKCGTRIIPAEEGTKILDECPNCVWNVIEETTRMRKIQKCRKEKQK